MRGLAGRNAIVTGAAGGIGRAIAERLAGEGCRVGIFDIDGAAGEATAAEIRATGGIVHAMRVDITDAGAVADGLAAFEAAAGPTDILVNNAGWDRGYWFIETDRAFWDKVIAINLYGPLIMHRAVLPGMADRRRGKVVNIASDAGRVGSSQEAIYSACKGGIIAFTKTIAREMASRNVQVNAISPGPTDTALFATAFGDNPDAGASMAAKLARAVPAGRIGRVTDYPGVVAFLASDDADYITGQTISVSGGLTMV